MTEEKQASRQATSPAAGGNDNPEGWHPYDARGDYGGAAQIVAQEFKYIHARRGEQAGNNDTPADMCGLALSGGGIRSASFCLGVLQALAYKDWLKRVDYLSTVSGGGYIGSSVSWLLHRDWETTDGEGNAKTLQFGVTSDKFPYRTYPLPAKKSTPVVTREPRAMLRWLRQHAKYLTPGYGINLFSLIAVVLRGSFLSLLVYLGLFALFFMGLQKAQIFSPVSVDWIARWSPSDTPWALAGAALLLVALALAAVLYALATRWFARKEKRIEGKSESYWWRRCYEMWAGRALLAALVLGVAGAIPLVHEWLAEAAAVTPQPSGAFELSGVHTDTDTLEIKGTVKLPPAQPPVSPDDVGISVGNMANAVVGLIFAVLGALSGFTAFLKTSSAKPGRIPLGVWVVAGATLLIFGLLLLAYQVALWWLGWELPAKQWWLYTGGAVLAILVVALYSNLNYISVHRYYRDRLMETFMPEVAQAVNTNPTEPGISETANGTRLSEVLPVKPTRYGESGRALGPYHIINSNVILVRSLIPKFQGRGGDNFVLSPLFCGSNATGWRATDKFMGNGMTLATAMAISGAAVNPSAGCGGEGATRQRVLAMLMGLLNVRLGYWAPNPDPGRQRLRGVPARMSRWLFRTPNFLYPGLWELTLRWNLSEDSHLLQLSDGGHFENLGLYELVRRRAKVIIVCDGAADPEDRFSDLANAMEKVRVDFNAMIDVSSEQLQSLVPRKHDKFKSGSGRGYAERGYLVANIYYFDKDKVTVGKLIYIKTTFYPELSADLYSYRERHPEFPDQSTADQFFDEKQFEAYRELGYQTAWRMTEDLLSLDQVLESTPA
ncbi:MAG: patatin-like phospholipase family protein [Pseudomonadota bacterium]|nr:MAG: patatin-like phospholipase family protein [Pseudomonadota bacterium]